MLNQGSYAKFQVKSDFAWESFLTRMKTDVIKVVSNVLPHLTSIVLLYMLNQGSYEKFQVKSDFSWESFLTRMKIDVIKVVSNVLPF